MSLGQTVDANFSVQTENYLASNQEVGNLKGYVLSLFIEWM